MPPEIHLLSKLISYILRVAEPSATTERKVEVTSKTPGGENTTTVELKTETTPTTEMTTTTQKVEKTGENPPPAVKP